MGVWLAVFQNNPVESPYKATEHVWHTRISSGSGAMHPSSIYVQYMDCQKPCRSSKYVQYNTTYASRNTQAHTAPY